jgi:hypothetical protein
MYVVPDGHTPEHFICVVVMPALRSMRSKDTPAAPGPPVRTATVK